MFDFSSTTFCFDRFVILLNRQLEKKINGYFYKVKTFIFQPLCFFDIYSDYIILIYYSDLLF